MRLCPPYGRVICIQFSNSHASSSSRRESRASPVLFFVGRSVTSGFFFSLPQIEGAERHWRQKIPCSVEHGAGLRRDRLRQRRSTAASSRLSPRPWGLASLWSRSRPISGRREGCKASLGVYLTPGGLIQGRPGLWLRTTGAGAAPRPHSARLQSIPQADGDASGLCRQPVSVHNKISSEGGSRARDCRN